MTTDPTPRLSSAIDLPPPSFPPSSYSPHTPNSSTVPTYPSPKSYPNQPSSVPAAGVGAGTATNGGSGAGLGPRSAEKLHPPTRPGRSESFSFPAPSSSYTRPPPLRTAHSAVSVHTPSTGYSATLMLRAGSDPERELDERDGPIDEREELTTKGRKRKRLAKACSACHKNKRRCDGFAPCSNCEFSSRPCLYLNAQGEPIPPPRTRDSSAAPNRNGKDDVKQPHTPSDKRGGGGGSNEPWSRRDSGPDERRSGVEKRAILDPIEAVERDPALSAELIDIFFRRAPPFGAMFHPATFQHRLYLNQVSPILLDAIYAFSARLCDNPSFLATLPPNHPPFLRGEAFAERAHSAAERLLKIRRSWSDEEARRDRGTWEETELVQASCLLSIYFALLRQPSLALFYLDISISILRPTSSATLAPPANHLGLSSTEYLTLMECRNRTFWLVVLHDLCAAANGRPRRLMDHEMYNIPLPGGESYWVRWGGAASGAREPARRDGLAPGTGTWAGDEGAVGELGHVLRILSIFSDIMAVANNGGAGSTETRHTPAHQHEHALKNWALNLPRHLRFDEINLSTAVAKLSSPLPDVALTGWMYAYMHAVAECGMFYLQAAIAQTPGAPFTAQRQSQAVDNIAVILDALGQRGREGPLLIFPIAVVSNWQDHLRSLPAPPTAQQLLLDDRLAVWWAEVGREWGQERHQLIEQGPYAASGVLTSSVGASAFSSSISSSSHLSSSLHHHRNSISTSAASPPGSANHRFSHLLEPSPALGLYHPSSSALTVNGNASGNGSANGNGNGTSPPRAPESAVSTTSSMTLPTPGPFRGQTTLPPLVRPRAVSSVLPFPTSLRSPSPPSSFGRHRHLPSVSSLSDKEGFINLPPLHEFRVVHSDRNKERERDSDRDRERLRGMERERSRDMLSDRERERDSPKYHPYKREKSPAVSLPSSASRNGGGGGAGGWGEPLGIAALVSAAEREREREIKESAGSRVEVV